MMKRGSIIRGTIILLTSVCLLAVFITGCRSNRQYKLVQPPKPAAKTAVWPGEFDKQQAVWLLWPSEVYETGSHRVSPVTVKIINALAPHIRVNVMVQNQSEVSYIESQVKQNSSNVRFFSINHLSIWARDVGPIFIKDAKNRLRVVDFGFNNYSRNGDPGYINTEAQVDKLTAKVLGLPVINTNLISEGGAIESNGRGTLMVTESVALARNPGLTKRQIEYEYKRVLGVRKVIWLKKGLAEDDSITGGHINEIARFAGPDTILLAQILGGDRYASNASAISYLRLEENYNILRGSTDQDGKPFRIIRIPMPPTLYQEANYTGELPVRSYLNYAVTNGAVLVQTYWEPGRSAALKSTEDRVRGVFTRVFPERDIIEIDAEEVNFWGGGIHCITQHMPAE